MIQFHSFAPSRRSRRLSSASPRHARRRGVAFVYTALGLAGALMLLAVVVDVGLLYQRKASMQRAADSAALAGAYTLANFGTSRSAYVSAGDMAARPENGGYTKRGNGTMVIDGVSGPYIVNVGQSQFNVDYPAIDEKGVQHNNWFKVTLSRPESALFGGMWPLNKSKYAVAASATALYETLAKLDIKGTGTYGVMPGPVNLSLFGPDGRYSYGDPYSTKYLNNGDPNPNYNANGYNFVVNVPSTMGQTSLEIFDPDCYNGNGSINASAAAIDEMRTRTGNGTIANATTTRYTLYWDRGTSDPSDDVRVGDSRDWGGDGADSDMQWVNAFEFNRADYVGGNFRLNVKSVSGSSENGFDLRAGPKREETTTYTTETYISGYRKNGKPIYSTRQVPTVHPAPDWDSANGTSIQAEGHLPINFNIDGTTKMALGKVPPLAGGGELIIRKFDTDINSRTITYTCDKLPGMSWPGTLSTDGAFATDTIRIPDSYRNLAEDGTWFAEYVAGNQDTSVWDMSYTGGGPGSPGKIRLVR